MMKSRDLIFFGNERLLLGVDFSKTPIFDYLLRSGWNITAVIVNDHTSKSRNFKPSAIIAKAIKYNIPVYCPSSNNEIIDIIKKHPAPLAILVSYGRLISEEVINFFTNGIINIHPSLLPKYRGPSPIETSLLNGDNITGVSLIKLVTKMDAGPIYDQELIDIEPTLTKFDLYQKITKSAINLLHRNLEKISLGLKIPTQQLEHEASFTSIIPKNAGLLKIDFESCQSLMNKIRAYQFYPKPKLNIHNKTCTILEANMLKNKPPATELAIKCKDGCYLIINKLIVPNGKAISGQEFVRNFL